ncbi:MAG: ComEC/Rec2 family competence protein [Prevotella sp.]|jgi:competence protein ComEC
MLFPKGFWQFYPYLRLSVFFIVGIIVGYYLAVPTVWVPFALAVAALGGAFTFLRRRYLSSAFIYCSVFFFGIVLMMSYSERMKVKVDSVVGHERNYKAVIASQPLERGKTMSMDLYLLDNGCKVKAHILKDDEGRVQRLIVGEGLVFHAMPERPKNWKNDGKFNYERWLNTHNFVATVFILPQDWHNEVLNISNVSHFQRAQWRMLSLRSKLIRELNLSSSDSSTALLLALALGDKRYVTKELRSSFSDAGAAHLLALSGLHLSILYGFITLLLSGFRRRWLTTFVSVLTIWIYVMLVGMPVSAVRAAIMLTIYGITSLGFREHVALNVLALTAMVMLTVNPLLLWDVSFELSFIAVLSIGIYFVPLYKIGVHWISPLRWLWGLVAVSIAAQIGTIPLVLYYFGRINLYSPLTSLVFIPLTMAILYLGFSGILVEVLGWNGSLLIGWAMKAAGWLGLGAQRVASWHGALLKMDNWSFIQTILLYILIIALSLIVFKAAQIIASGRVDMSKAG